MGRAPCCDKEGLKKGPWTTEEDKILIEYIQANGHGTWRSLPKQAGLLRCGKSCRLRWINYLRPDIKRGPFTPEEQNSIVHLHGIVGNKWSAIAAQLPGRTDNEVKNYWNTHLKKRLFCSPSSPSSAGSGGGGGEGGSDTPAASVATKAASFSCAARHMAQWESARVEAEARLSRSPLLVPASCAATAASAPPDFFLRMWHSEVGEAFRGRDGAASAAASSPTSSSTKHGSSTPMLNENQEEQHRRAGVVVSSGELKEDGDRRSSGPGGGDNAESVAGGGAAADSWSSNETGEGTPEEAYQMYLDMVGDDEMALGQLFQDNFGSFSWLGGDVADGGPLDTAFK